LGLKIGHLRRGTIGVERGGEEKKEPVLCGPAGIRPPDIRFSTDWGRENETPKRHKWGAKTKNA